MRNFLLTLCFVPAFAIASSENGNHIEKMIKKQPEINLLKSSEAVTLDSVYVYSDGILSEKLYYSYDAEGRKESVESKQRYSMSSEFRPVYKTLFRNYMEDDNNGIYWEESTFNYKGEGKWIETSRSKNHAWDNGLQDYFEEYSYIDGDWVKTWVWRPVEIKDNYPIAVVDSSYEGSMLTVTKMTLSFDAAKRVESSDYLLWDETVEDWILLEKIKFEYKDATGKDYVVRHYVQDDSGEWNDEYGYIYEFDERGNQILEKAYGDFDLEVKNRNFYSDYIVTHNEKISADTSVRWRFDSSSDILFVDNISASKQNLTLYNMQGLIVESRLLPEGKSEISFRGLAHGVYILRIGDRIVKVKH